MPVVLGGIVPKQDHAQLEALGVKRVFTPTDYKLTDIVGALIDLCRST
jgi:ethylmalonyl-CoA mutase